MLQYLIPIVAMFASINCFGNEYDFSPIREKEIPTALSQDCPEGICDTVAGMGNPISIEPVADPTIFINENNSVPETCDNCGRIRMSQVSVLANWKTTAYPSQGCSASVLINGQILTKHQWRKMGRPWALRPGLFNLRWRRINQDCR